MLVRTSSSVNPYQLCHHLLDLLEENLMMRVGSKPFAPFLSDACYPLMLDYLDYFITCSKYNKLKLIKI